jgi:hypothetical protein
MHHDVIPACCFIVCALVIIGVCGHTYYVNELTPEAKLKHEVFELRKQKELIQWKKEKASLEWYLEQERKKVENE